MLLGFSFQIFDDGGRIEIAQAPIERMLVVFLYGKPHVGA
jgi:hypothetical protein